MTELTNEQLHLQLGALKNRYNNLVLTTQEQNKTIQDLTSALISANKRLENCQRALEINKEIMMNALTEQNKIKETYSEEIGGLKDKINILESA